MLAVQWGAWASGGMASAAVVARLERIGQGVLRPAAGLAALAHALQAAAAVTPSPALAWGGRPPGTGVLTVNPFAWDRYVCERRGAQGPVLHVACRCQVAFQQNM